MLQSRAPLVTISIASQVTIYTSLSFLLFACLFLAIDTINSFVLSFVAIFIILFAVNICVTIGLVNNFPNRTFSKFELSLAIVQLALSIFQCGIALYDLQDSEPGDIRLLVISRLTMIVTFPLSELLYIATCLSFLRKH